MPEVAVQAALALNAARRPGCAVLFSAPSKARALGAPACWMQIATCTYLTGSGPRIKAIHGSPFANLCSEAAWGAAWRGGRQRRGAALQVPAMRSAVAGALDLLRPGPARPGGPRGPCWAPGRESARALASTSPLTTFSGEFSSFLP